MTSVNWRPTPGERHVPVLMGLLHRRVSETFAAEDWDGLRQSHLRVISGVPEEGISVTALGERVGMTKQGCGQFVRQLQSRGLLRVAVDPGDRRVRRVLRTAEGERTVRAMVERIGAMEHDWEELVGRDRYATFRDVLERIALGDDDGTA